MNAYLHDKHDEESEKWTYSQAQECDFSNYGKKKIVTGIKTMDAVFSRNRLEEPLVTYRGIGNNLPDQLEGNAESGGREAMAYLHDKYPVGETITVPEYMSTSVDPASAHKFAGYQNIVLEIKAKNALPVGFFSAWNDSEKEYIVNRGGKYKVIGIHNNVTYDEALISLKDRKKLEADNGVTVVQLEEL